MGDGPPSDRRAKVSPSTAARRAVPLCGGRNRSGDETAAGRDDRRAKASLSTAALCGSCSWRGGYRPERRWAIGLLSSHRLLSGHRIVERGTLTLHFTERRNAHARDVAAEASSRGTAPRMRRRNRAAYAVFGAAMWHFRKAVSASPAVLLREFPRRFGILAANPGSYTAKVSESWCFAHFLLDFLREQIYI
jgi:hypothetical protein